MAFVESAAQTGANWEIVYAWTDLKSISGIHWEKKSSPAFLNEWRNQLCYDFLQRIETKRERERMHEGECYC